MKKAGYTDKSIVVNILSRSFQNDPHINWLLEDSKSQNKLKKIMEYVFEESLGKGDVYLSDDEMAAALWNYEKREKVSLRYVVRNLSFLLEVGIKATIRILKTDKLTYSQYPKNEKYCQLYLIGVLPEAQGKGLASSLIDPMIERMEKEAITMHLETANPKNVAIYMKKGFNIIHSIPLGKNTFCWMRRKSSGLSSPSVVPC